MPLLMLAACSSEADNTPAPSAPTYTMTGNTGAIESRVTYKDDSNTMNCCWEKGDTVLLKADGADETYAFVVTSVDGAGVGTMAYEGAIHSADNFTGTATYAPRDAAKAGIQTENDHTGHLKYGETMVAKLTNQKINGASLVFSHPATAVYKVTFKAPANFSAGSTLTMSGAWADAAVLKLGFGAAKDDIVTAYIIHTSGSLASGGKMHISLDDEDGHVYTYTFQSTKALTYSVDRYWLANIVDKEMKLTEYIDLGLPSGVKWATCNLGAAKPEEYGDYYGWGCTEPYADYDMPDWVTYFEKLGVPDCEEAEYTDCGTDMDPLRDYVSPNNKSIAGTKWDAARQKLGGTWRMPTTEELQELMNTDYCDYTWTTENGVNGVKVMSKKNGNSIFLPAASSHQRWFFAGTCGFYWSSSPRPGHSEQSYCINIASGFYDGQGSEARCEGLPIRPVIE